MSSIGTCYTRKYVFDEIMFFGGSSDKKSAAQAVPAGPSFEEQLPTVREFLREYNRIAEVCFNDCINDFTGRTTTTFENTCVNNCLEKFLKVTQRISQRFQEQQMLMNENQVVAGKAKGLFQ
ncbi:unnamed protein product [Rotaria magnacalcarata]|uniref:Mitochondrial import inner membrane translocase subunit n=2 Tax=Rotaria magnacalcarata TaxID=392030 RepID=A0A816SHL8_9BILA|nr:unnamed protein product [Rotaria magnacalcarata]CAF1585101.1 unnamed protein product [Rotaria magnacalcarata]CAF2018852.1 unnamed protein product [Rotaria magnacalcarata]CAF2085773.1 unnamed protein product [Rotaria magnacalcarata]